MPYAEHLVLEVSWLFEIRTEKIADTANPGIKTKFRIKELSRENLSTPLFYYSQNYIS
jgi:hypothetical protein